MRKHRFFYMEERRALTDQELHNLAMNIVGKELEADGFEFMAVNSKLKKNPQYVCLKEKILHFIVVRNVEYPMNSREFDKELMQKMKDHAIKFEAKTYFAGVGLSNASNQELPVFLNEEYLVDYQGLIEI
ncbi:Na(+)-translocating NADH-quinone reductase subunit F [Flagellimonas hymeniacidonis]|nr:Na(+)-translocating NADH-quinone reductase subunit F [Flagellimonas hymeniacidonis]